MAVTLRKHLRRLAKKALFGDTFLSQEFFVGLPDPQTEISVWLHGHGAPIDVTARHTMACAAPLSFCVAFDAGRKPEPNARLTLKFCDGYGETVLGEVGLRFEQSFSLPENEIVRFTPRSSSNYCLPGLRLCAHYLFQSYAEQRMSGTSGMKMSFLEKRAACVNFIRPHPVVLGSVFESGRGNIFPMNIMGDLGHGDFAFALKDSRRAAHLVERFGRLAISSLPMPQASLAYQLAINHTKDFIDWEQLPFATRNSPLFGIPVPVFTQRVRELEVRKVQPLGSHTFFVARVAGDQTFSAALGLCVIHGFYQAWRLRGRRLELQEAVSADAFYKRGVYQS